MPWLAIYYFSAGDIQAALSLKNSLTSSLHPPNLLDPSTQSGLSQDKPEIHLLIR